MTDMIVIAHGLSEIILCQGIFSKLGFTRKAIDSREKGEKNISMSGIAKFLSTGDYSTTNKVHKKYPAFDYHITNRKIVFDDLKVFPIMDVDRDREYLNSYKSKDLFRESCLYDSITPIWTDKSLDDAVRSFGYNITEDNKIRMYRKMMDELTVEELLDRFERCENTNLEVFIRTVMEHTPRFQ